MNGRTIGDRPSSYTYLGPRGKSVIDLVWINWNYVHLIDNMFIDYNINNSDHFPCVLQLRNIGNNNTNSNNNLPCIQFQNYKWNESKILEYQEFLQTGLNDDCESYSDLVTIIENAANMTGMIQKIYINQKNIEKNKTWFDKSCKEHKKKVRNALKVCRNSNFELNTLNAYLKEKQEYNKVKETAKRKYYNEIEINLTNVKNSVEFWKAVKCIKNRRKYVNNISITEWETYLIKLYKKELIPDEIRFQDCLHPLLDKNTEWNEVKEVLKKCKNGKSPGTDLIRNEFWKNLPDNGIQCVIKIFNKIIENENIPDGWGKSFLHMIHKKGDCANPENYRGITLANSILKIFTAIINNRIENYVEINYILPEEQNGFRKRRGCRDNIYILNSLVNQQLRLPKSKLFTIFIDYKRAFDSIDRNILWQKLFYIGISSKIIRIIRNIYENIEICIRKDDEYTGFVKPGLGLMQGDSLSALLFALYISDLNANLQSSGCPGVDVDAYNTLQYLAYADDLVFLSTTHFHAQRQLQILEKYNDKNKLELNVEKTKVLIFHKGRLRDKMYQFNYKQKQIEIVKNFNYLGIKFSSSGAISTMAKDIVDRSNKALGAVRTIIDKINTWEGKMKIYRTMITSILLYTVETWAFQCSDLLEKIQVRFFKLLFAWPKNTPNYLVRYELGINKIEFEIFKKSYKWWIHILELEENRWIKICYKKQFELDKNILSTKMKFNWVTCFKSFFVNSRFYSIWEQQNPNLAWQNYDNMLGEYKNKLIEQDLDRIHNSTYNNLYKELIFFNNNQLSVSLFNFTEKYKLVSQIKMSNENLINIYTKRFKIKIFTNDTCVLCQTGQRESIQHIISECPVYDEVRNIHLISNNIQPSIYILQLYNLKQFNIVYKFLTNCFDIRSNIIG